MAAAEGEKKMVTLKSSDGEEFKIDEAAAMESQIIRPMIEGDCADNVIPVPNVNSKILSKVIEYCTKHARANPKSAEAAGASSEDLGSWDAEFVQVNDATLFDLINAANYLDIKGLLDLTCQAVADKMKRMTPEEIRKAFNIKNMFTPEEEDEVRSAGSTSGAFI